jgi:hypothetical protein
MITAALNTSEQGTPVWGKVEAHMTRRLEVLANELKQDKDLLTTSKIRGRIAEIEAFLRVMKVTRESVVDAG